MECIYLRDGVLLTCENFWNHIVLTGKFYLNKKFSGKYAVVVMGDIAVYEPGPARCTGG